MRTIAAILVAGLVVTMVARGADPETRPPVPLYEPPLLVPEEMAGLGLAPEVTVRVTVDAGGRVSAVDVLEIRPASEYDEIFSKAARDTLMRWRYAPATREGQPVETELEWTVQYPTVAELHKEDGPVTSFSIANWGERGVREFRSRVLSLPLEQRKKLLVEKAEIAHDCLSSTTRSVASIRFKVYTDAPKEDTARVLAGNLEATFGVLDGLVGRDLATQPEPYRIAVFLYSSESDFARLKERVQALEWAEGFYNPLGLLAFHMEMPSNESLLAIMLHEATHAYLDRYIARPGVVFPRWLDEGLAEYIGNSQIKKGQLIPGRTRKTETYRTPWRADRGRSMARYTIDEIKRAMEEGRALTLEQLVNSDIEEFYGAKREQYYPMSWMLIHFLRHGRKTWDDALFSELVLYLAEGYPAPQAFAATYGAPAELERTFRRYVRGL